MTLNRLLGTRTVQFALFKYTLYTLLTFNIYLFALNGTFTETIDTAAWVVILGLFEWETRTMGKADSGPLRQALIVILSFSAYSVIMYACYAYYAEGKWLDFANSLTWILVIAALQYDVYFEGNYSRFEQLIRTGVKIVLYGALLIFALIWGIRGEVLSFYDAFLWMLSFVVIELDVFRFENRGLEENPLLADT